MPTEFVCVSLKVSAEVSKNEKAAEGAERSDFESEIRISGLCVAIA